MIKKELSSPSGSLMNLNDIIFENRNKEYGAYFIRQRYNKNLAYGILLGLLSFFAFLVFLNPNLFWNRDNEDLEYMKEFVMPDPVLTDMPKYTVMPETKKSTPKDEKEPIKEKAEIKDVIKDNPTPKIDNPTPSTTNDAQPSGTNAEKDNNATADSGKSIEGQGDEGRVVQFAENMPVFPGCEDIIDLLKREECTRKLFTEFIQRNVKYPDEAIKNNITGKVIVQFIVEKNGLISEIKVYNDIGYGTKAAAINAVKALNEMTKKIKPGSQGGRTVRVKYNIPLNFNLRQKATKTN